MCLAEILAWDVCILPHVLLGVSTFSVVAVDFSRPYLIRSGNSFTLSCLAEQVGAAVSQPPFLSPNAAITILSPLPRAVRAHLLLQDHYSVGLTGSASHISKATCLSTSAGIR